MLPLLCGEWYCMNFAGDVSELEKYECVRVNWLMVLFNMVLGEIVCFEYCGIVRCIY